MRNFLKSIFLSFKFAVSGIFYTLQTQNTAKVHFVATLVVIALGLWLDLPLRSWALISLAILIVWIAELLNTSLENLFDLIEPKRSEFVEHGKDAAAGAVLLVAVLSLIIGILVLGPPLIAKLRLG